MCVCACIFMYVYVTAYVSSRVGASALFWKFKDGLESGLNVYRII